MFVLLVSSIAYVSGTHHPLASIWALEHNNDLSITYHTSSLLLLITIKTSTGDVILFTDPVADQE